MLSAGTGVSLGEELVKGYLLVNARVFIGCGRRGVEEGKNKSWAAHYAPTTKLTWTKHAEPLGQVGQELLNIWAANCSRLTLHPVYGLSGAKECKTLRALVLALVLPYTMTGHGRDLHSPTFVPGNPTLSFESRFVNCLSVYHLLEMLPGDLDGATSLLAMK